MQLAAVLDADKKLVVRLLARSHRTQTKPQTLLKHWPQPDKSGPVYTVLRLVISELITHAIA